MNTTLITHSLDAIEECLFSHVEGYQPAYMRHRRAENAARTIAFAATMAREPTPVDPAKQAAIELRAAQRAHWREVMRRLEEQGG